MIKALILDCGGVMVQPREGDWMLPPGYQQYLGADFIERHGEAFRAAKAQAFDFLPDARKIATDQEEYALLRSYYDIVLNRELGLALDEEAIAAIARLQAYGDERYIFFDDVAPYMDRWKERFQLGMLSDAPPSLGRIMQVKGYLQKLHGYVLSCELGVLKPDPAMYQAILDRLNVRPQEAVFVDDLPKNLLGAQALGIHCVQMLRPMPDFYHPAPGWDGPQAHGFRELNQLLSVMAAV